MIELGQLSRIDPTEVWEDEANDFTPWLADNLALLGQALGLDLEFVERERDVGDFSVDIVAQDERERVVVIENQLKQTDHDHLGKLITYAAGLDAGVVIWISRKFREEHRQALDWLNHANEGRTEFFGVVLEVIRVDGSKPAINFRPVAFPNPWQQATASLSDGKVSERRVAYQKFFQQLVDELREQHKFTNSRVARPSNWDSFTAGVRGFRWSFSFALGNRVRAEIYIDTKDAERNEKILDHLMQDRDSIEKDFGEKLEWERLEAKRACRIACYREGSIDSSDQALAEIRDWGVDRLLRFKKTFSSRIRDLKI